jgi:cytoskeletal protein RodZ
MLKDDNVPLTSSAHNEPLASEGSDYILIDTPGKVRTLSFIKYFIVGIIGALIIYGFVFDKWNIQDLPKKAEDPTAQSKKSAKEINNKNDKAKSKSKSTKASKGKKKSQI